MRRQREGGDGYRKRRRRPARREVSGSWERRSWACQQCRRPAAWEHEGHQDQVRLERGCHLDAAFAVPGHAELETRPLVEHRLDELHAGRINPRCKGLRDPCSRRGASTWLARAFASIGSRWKALLVHSPLSVAIAGFMALAGRGGRSVLMTRNLVACTGD